MELRTGDIWRVRVGASKTVLGKITKVGKAVTLTRIKADGDEFGADHELHVIVATADDLVRRMEFDNYYGEIVPFGKAKKHSCNG